MKFHKLLLSLTLLLLSFSALPITLNASEGRERPATDNRVYVDEISEGVLSDNEFFLTRQKTAKFRSGFFFLNETRDKTGSRDYTTSFDIEGSHLTVHYKIDKKLLSMDLSQGGKAPLSSELYIETESSHLYLGQANQLVDADEGVFRKLAPLTIEITKKEGGYYNIKLRYAANKDARNLSWGLCSDRPLLDLDSPTIRAQYENYDLQNRALLGYEGYMYFLEGRENEYFLIPSPYLVTNFYKNEETLLGNVLGHILLKLAAKNINEDGYFPVVPISEWLYRDYGIEGYYFDNRWNADLALALMKNMKKQYNTETRRAYLSLLKHFIAHINEHSLHTPNDGLLNYDYSVEGRNIKTHTSLNHQLNLINMLFEAASMEKDPVYLEYAKKLILGIDYIGSGWVKEDGSLHYAYLTDGTLDYQDYDLLTYNDALITRGYMDRLDGIRSEALDKIMEKKLGWIRDKGYGHLYE